MKFTMFRLPAVRKFDYKPRYYDPEKEARESRRRIVLGDDYLPETAQPAHYTSRIKGSMRKKHILFTEVAKQEKKKSNLRLLFIAIILAIIAYYLYDSSGEWLDLMFHK